MLNVAAAIHHPPSQCVGLSFAVKGAQGAPADVCAADHISTVRLGDQIASVDARAAAADINVILPRLESDFAGRRQCHYADVRPMLLVRATIDYFNQRVSGNPNALRLLYFADARQFAGNLQRLQQTLAPAETRFLAGALRLSHYQHHAAVVALITHDRTAILVLDSLLIKRVNADSTAMRAQQYTTHALRRKLSNRAPCFAGGFHHELFDAVRNLPQTSVYYTYVGSQTSGKDCASFALDMLEHIQTDPGEEYSHYSLLNQNVRHVTAENPAAMIPGLRSVVTVKGGRSGILNRHFVLNGEALLPARYYRHAQSRTQLQRYIARSPLVDTPTQTQLLEYHDAHRLTMLVPRRGRKPATVTANFSIREIQIDVLKRVGENFTRHFGPPG